MGAGVAVCAFDCALVASVLADVPGAGAAVVWGFAPAASSAALGPFARISVARQSEAMENAAMTARRSCARPIQTRYAVLGAFLILGSVFLLNACALTSSLA